MSCVLVQSVVKSTVYMREERKWCIVYLVEK